MKNVKWSPFTLCMVILLCICSPGIRAQTNAKWNNSSKIKSEDTGTTIHFGGRIMWDNAFFFQDQFIENKFGSLGNGNEFRRVRFFSSGIIYHTINYKLNIDFAGGEISYKDVFIGISDIPIIGNFRVGHYKEPIRLETQTSSKSFVFMERSFPIDFIPERNSGMMIFNDYAKDRISYQLGFFRRANDAGNDKTANEGFAVTGRITGLPYRNAIATKLVHIGIGFSYRDPKSNEYKIESKPESHLGKRYVSTGLIQDVEKIFMTALEASVVMGSFAWQSEFIQSNVAIGNTPNTLVFNSFYFQLGYFITGEHRRYKSSLSGFDRIIPNQNYSPSGGIGAWEVAIRYSTIDLNSSENPNFIIEGGQQEDLVFALNWYLNPAARIMFNYIFADVAKIGQVHIAQMRFQLEF